MLLRYRKIDFLWAFFWCFMALPAQAQTCAKQVFLTFDTGNMSVASYVLETLKKHQIHATFFLANEKTQRGDMALDDSWRTFWQKAVQDGHQFGSHTLNHSYFQRDGQDHHVIIKPQFGPNANHAFPANTAEVCAQIRGVDDRFYALTNTHLQKIWRAPGGKISDQLIQMAQSCGFQHIGWSEAGFLGDELSSEQHPNAQLLKKALQNIQDGDILMAHLGIWSRKDPWATGVLEPLIMGLQAKGFCFKTIGEKP